MNPRSPVARATLLVTATLVLLPSLTWAVSPPPDGGYANETTAEGEDALFSLTNGYGNTARLPDPLPDDQWIWQHRRRRQDPND